MLRLWFVLVLHLFLYWRQILSWVPLSSWQLYLPQAGTNIVDNPSLELTSTGYAASGGATISRSTDAAAFGGWGLKAVTTATDTGWAYTLPLSSGVTYTASVYVELPAGATAIMRWRNGGTQVASTTVPASTSWQRVVLSYTAAASASYNVGIWIATTTGTFYSDGLQVEISTEATTYIDGDQPGCIWNGARHASTSTRSAQWRGGGAIVDLDDYSFFITDHTGTGSTDYENVSTDNGILGGATFERSIVRPRPFQITGWFEATTQLDYHTKRQALLDAFKPNRVAPQQPVTLRYSGNDAGPRIIHCHYESGLEAGLTYPNAYDIPIRFVAYDPYWYSEHHSGKSLSAFDNVTDADYVLERSGDNGTWHALAGGLNGVVRAAVYGPDGNLYVAGDFVTAHNAAGTGSPVTVNRVAMWDGTTWTALGGGFSGLVLALAFDPAGNLYAGGSWIDAAYPFIAKWNGSTWSAVGSAAAGTGIVYALTYNPVDASLYIGGEFLNWNGNADADRIVRWDGSAYVAVAGGVNGIVLALTHDLAGNVYAGGTLTIAYNGTGATSPVTVNRIAKWDRTAWSALGSGLNNQVSAVLVDRSGILYAGGNFTDAAYPYLAMWNGSSWSALGSGVNNAVHALNIDLFGRLVVGGAFTSAGGLTLRDRTALWDGSAWRTFAVDLPGSAIVFAVAINIYTGEMTLGYDTSGTAVVSNTTDVTVTNPGTEDVAPVIAIYADGGTVESVTNWTTGKAIYFDLTMQTGEYAFLDLSTLTPQYSPLTSRPPYGRHGPRLWSNFRGEITRLILPNSDLATFRLLPGENVILVKTKNAGAAAGFWLYWRSRYLSLDA